MAAIARVLAERAEAPPADPRNDGARRTMLEKACERGE